MPVQEVDPYRQGRASARVPAAQCIAPENCDERRLWWAGRRERQEEIQDVKDRLRASVGKCWREWLM